MGSKWQLPYSIECIDKIEQLHGVELTFENLRDKYGTFRSERITDGRLGEKRYRSRVGVQTEVGDIVEPLWMNLVKDLIIQSGEETLYKQLKAFLQINRGRIQEKNSLEKEALELHAARIFDNPMWVCFIPFNKKYRPEILETADLVTIITDCCNKPGKVTKQRIEWNKYYKGTDCPHCGKLSSFRYASKEEV